MADEITLSLSLTVNKGNIVNENTVKVSSLKLPLAAATPRKCESIQTVATAYEAVVFSADIGTAGYTYFKNWDSNNYVEIGVEVAATFYPLVKLGPKDACILKLATNTIFAQANTAPVELEMKSYSA